MAFIKIDRKFFDGKFWNQKRIFSQAEAWIDLIRMARFETETEVKLLPNGKIIKIERGDIHASLRYLADRWGWGVDKTKRFIDYTILENAIERKTEQGESILTLLNYDSYNPLLNIDQYSDRYSDRTHFATQNQTATERKTEQHESVITPSNSDNYDIPKKRNRTVINSKTSTVTDTVTSTNKEYKELKKEKNIIIPGVKKTPDSIHSICKEIFHEKFRNLFGEEYYWEAKDAANLNPILKKIKFNREKKGMPVDDDSVRMAFEFFLDSITDKWLMENYSISNINSKFNEIISQAKQNGARKQKQSTSDDELIANIKAGIRRGIEENSV